MKNKLLLFVSLLAIIIMPLTVFAESYNADDITIELNDWTTLTRDNIKDNKEMDELGVTYEYMDNFFKTNNAYLDAIKFDSDESMTELIIAAKKSEVESNFNKYSAKDVEESGKEMQKKSGADKYEIVDFNNYKYIKVKYKDVNLNYNIIDYYTIMNGKVYTIKYQKQDTITEENEKEYDSIVKSISFKYNKDYDKEPETVLNKALKNAISGGITGALCGLLAYGAVTVGKKLKKKEEK